MQALYKGIHTPFLHAVLIILAWRISKAKSGSWHDWLAALHGPFSEEGVMPLALIGFGVCPRKYEVNSTDGRTCSNNDDTPAAR